MGKLLSRNDEKRSATLLYAPRGEGQRKVPSRTEGKPEGRDGSSGRRRELADLVFAGCCDGRIPIGEVAQVVAVVVGISARRQDVVALYIHSPLGDGVTGKIRY